MCRGTVDPKVMQASPVVGGTSCNRGIPTMRWGPTAAGVLVLGTTGRSGARGSDKVVAAAAPRLWRW